MAPFVSKVSSQATTPSPAPRGAALTGAYLVKRETYRAGGFEFLVSSFTFGGLSNAQPETPNQKHPATRDERRESIQRVTGRTESSQK